MKKFRDFESARKFVIILGLKNWEKWKEYCKSGKKPDDIPNFPNQVYKNKGWVGIENWLGNGRIATKNRKYRPFKEAREFVRKLGLKNWEEWREYCKSGKKPEDIPNAPDQFYKEWKIQRRIAKK